jgi:dienelactone hydrolase
MTALLQYFEFSPKKKVVLMGYDLGGAIALSCALHPKLSKTVSQLVVFHPTWTDSVERVATISLPTLLFWMPVETFHLISAGQKMAKLIKKSKLYRLNVGPYTGEKAGGYYDSYAEIMHVITAGFIRDNSEIKEEICNISSNRDRGRIV